jgi:hypothetical protein
VISAFDNCEPKAGMDRPSASIGGLMPLRITSPTLSDARRVRFGRVEPKTRR